MSNFLDKKEEELKAQLPDEYYKVRYEEIVEEAKKLKEQYEIFRFRAEAYEKQIDTLNEEIQKVNAENMNLRNLIIQYKNDLEFNKKTLEIQTEILKRYEKQLFVDTDAMLTYK